MRWMRLAGVVRQLVVAVMLGGVLTSGALAATLFEQSLPLFEARAQKASPKDYTFVVLGDSRDGERIFKKAILLAASYDPLFIVHGGDYSGRGTLPETERFLALVRETVPQLPVFVVMGNHENRSVFAQKVGPSRFTLESRRLGLTVVALDDSDEVLRPEDLSYLRSRLAVARGASFVAMHVPPRTERWTWHVFTEGSAELKKILSEGQVAGAFFSHVHLFARDEFGGVPAIITGGAGAPLVRFGFPGDPVYHIVVVHVRDGEASFEKVPIPE